jgi:hypothetical protein
MVHSIICNFEESGTFLLQRFQIGMDDIGAIATLITKGIGTG